MMKFLDTKSMLGCPMCCSGLRDSMGYLACSVFHVFLVRTKKQDEIFKHEEYASLSCTVCCSAFFPTTVIFIFSYF